MIDNANLSGLGDVSRREPKLTNSSAQILFFRRALKRLPKGTPILKNKGALGNISLPDDSTASTGVLVRDCTSRCTASATRLMEREEFWAALVDCIAVFTAATIDETIALERPSDSTPDVDASTAAWEGGDFERVRIVRYKLYVDGYHLPVLLFVAISFVAAC